MIGRKNIMVRDVSNEVMEKLEFPDRVIKVELGYNHMVVVTPSQCHIYTTKNWNTPVIFDLREGSVCMLHLTLRHFLLVEKSSLSLYSYEGRLLCSPRWQGMQPETLNPAYVSISPDTIAVRDQNDDKLVYLFELSTGRSLVDLPPLKHTSGIAEVALNQAGSPSERQLVVVDKNRDIYLTNVRSSMRLRKLGSMIQSLCWNSEVNMLAAVQDTHLIVWNYPTALFVDKKIMKKTVLLKDTSEFGKSPIVVSFEGNQLGIRRVDGSLVNSYISPYPSVLHGYAASAQWDDALRLCRFVQLSILCTCMFVTYWSHNQCIDPAEEAYAAIDEMDKVTYLQYIKTIPVQAVQMAEMAMFGGNIYDAETILLQNGLVFRAILTNVQLHKWNRALELAVKHKTHVDTVLFLRKNYLDRFEKTETNEKFLRFKDEVKLDAEKITAKMEVELLKERDKK
ncbi:hypothetical protein L9F63_000044 [Diploptera punctata]|uniref:Intraflagellar transport protein 80 homolog n=1 Tax=Diploptera punctata TaxID=6984 RepID=A0AAD8ANF2_DIPPU|nr:hypothetical protein L9F63_000044 [Diploptera punctata]